MRPSRLLKAPLPPLTHEARAVDAPATTAAPAAAISNDGTRIFASPLARRIAADQGLDLAKITGSGPKGRIVKTDVSGAPATASVSAPPPMAATPRRQLAQLRKRRQRGSALSGTQL